MMETVLSYNDVYKTILNYLPYAHSSSFEEAARVLFGSVPMRKCKDKVWNKIYDGGISPEDLEQLYQIFVADNLFYSEKVFISYDE